MTATAQNQMAEIAKWEKWAGKMGMAFTQPESNDLKISQNGIK